MKRARIILFWLVCLLGAILVTCSDDSSSPTDSSKSKPKIYQLLATNAGGITLSIQANQTVEISATDSVNTNPGGPVQGCDLWTDANGLPNCSYVTSAPECRGLPFMALIGYFDSRYFLVGTDFDSTFADGGPLQLLINDWVFTDNQGKFTITVLVK